jgi:translation elongation factor EF-1beta/SAM-dependent methyltransferase
MTNDSKTVVGDNDYAARAAEAQDKLGDPSGQSGTQYWDQWFETVSAGSSFEWYTTPSEIIRVLKQVLFFPDSTKVERGEGCDKCSSGRETISALHAGSGNSMLPIEMAKVFCGRQVVLDCSSVAIDEMRARYTKIKCDNSSNDDNMCQDIEFALGDVLSTEGLSFDSKCFDAWIDKGLLDAIFSESSDVEQQQCQQMLNEANRLLRPGGVCLIASLAQFHSLELIWSSLDLLNESSNWEDMNIFEVAPTSDASSLRPFVFVIRKVQVQKGQNHERCIIFNHYDGRCSRFDRKGETIFNDIIMQLNNSRTAFASMVQQNVTMKRLSLATLHIKPYDNETDLKQLSYTIEEKCATAFSTFTRNASVLVPIGFGLNKIELKFIISSEEIEDVCDFIMDEEEDAVQSVDIDWENTFHCGDTASLLKTHMIK